MFTGLLPKLAAARVTLWSKPDNVAVTVITTNGVPKLYETILFLYEWQLNQLLP